MTLTLRLCLHATKLFQLMESTSMVISFAASAKDEISALSASWHHDRGGRRSEVHP